MGSCVSHCSRQDIVHQQTGRLESTFFAFMLISYVSYSSIDYFIVKLYMCFS